MKKPIIGIFCGVGYNKLGSTEVRIKNYVFEKYIKAVTINGGLAILIPPMMEVESMKEVLELCDGLLFPGGEDIDPKLYNQNPHKELGRIEPKVDKVWYDCVKYAIDKNIPTLGICKGMQMINIAAGGTLYQDIYSEIETDIQHNQKSNRTYSMHRVHIKRDSKLNEIMRLDSIFTNTIHHQAIKDLGKGLRAVAYAEDNIIEAIESEDKDIIAVQWHPEELIDGEARMNKIFEYLCKKAKEYKEK